MRNKPCHLCTVMNPQELCASRKSKLLWKLSAVTWIECNSRASRNAFQISAQSPDFKSHHQPLCTTKQRGKLHGSLKRKSHDKRSWDKDRGEVT